MRFILVFIYILSSTFAAHAEGCGSKTNYVLQMFNPGNTTQVSINNLQNVILCLGSYYVGGPGIYTPSPINVQNFQTNNFSCSSASTCQAAADITLGGVSTTNQIGGVDVGSVLADTDYCLWIVSKGTTSIADIGLTWSAECGNAGPRPPISVNYPYYAYLGWNRTNSLCPGAGCGFIYGTVTVGQWVQFVQDTRRCTGIVSCLPLVASGSATKWTPLWMTHFLPPGGDTVIFEVFNSSSGGHVAVAPNVQFNNSGSLISNGLCDNNSVVGMSLLCGPMVSDRGLLAYWSTSAAGFVYLSGYHDGQL